LNYYWLWASLIQGVGGVENFPDYDYGDFYDFYDWDEAFIHRITEI
jgi:hypothetical protein